MSTIIKATIRGISPLLMNPVSEATLEGLRTGVREPVVKDRSRDEVVAEKIYVNDGFIGMPTENLFSCLVIAGRQVKNGKKQISTASSTVLPAFLNIQEDFLPFTNFENGMFGHLGQKNGANGNGNGNGNGHYDGPLPYKIDFRRGRNPHDGVMVALVRPKFPAWEFECTLDMDDSLVNEKVIRELLTVAGRSVGLGDFRPSCKGRFGRFMVTGWDVKKNGKQ